MRLYTLLSIAGLVALGGAGADDLTKKELEVLRGKWNVVEGAAEKSNILTQFQFLEDRLWIEIGGNVGQFKFKIDPSKKPKEIDVLQSLADGSERVAMVGIYELKGDRLGICFEEKKRPTEFRRDSKGPTLYRFERERKKP